MGRNINILDLFLFFNNGIWKYFTPILVFGENENYSPDNHSKASFEISHFQTALPLDYLLQASWTGVGGNKLINRCSVII